MKKLIVAMLVLALALSAASAGVNFSGNLEAGYAFQYNHKTDSWTNHIMGEDGEDINTTQLDLSIGDDDGIWQVNIEANPTLNDDGAVSGDISVDLAKSFAAINNSETDWTAKLSLNVMDRVTALRAYSMEKSFDRIRTAEAGVWASLNLGYSDWIELQIAGSPATAAVTDEVNQIKENEGDFLVSALVRPLDGLAISAGYVLKGDAKDSGSDYGTDNYAGGLVATSADINVGELAGLDFSFGVGLSEKYDIEGKNNIFAAAVYGGFDPVSFTLQYGLKSYNTADDEHFMYAAVDVTAVENMLLDLYFGAYNAAEFADSWYIGGDIGYTLANVTYKLGVEYGAGTSFNYNDSYYKTDNSGAGLWIVPSIAVAW